VDTAADTTGQKLRISVNIIDQPEHLFCAEHHQGTASNTGHGLSSSNRADFITLSAKIIPKTAHKAATRAVARFTAAATHV
jgi:hypothetical protein